MFFIPAGTTREFQCKVKLSDNSEVIPNTVDWSIVNDNAFNDFTIVANSYRCYVTANRRAPVNATAKVTANATYTHAGQTLKYQTTFEVICTEAPPPATNPDDPISMELLAY